MNPEAHVAQDSQEENPAVILTAVDLDGLKGPCRAI